MKSVALCVLEEGEGTGKPVFSTLLQVHALHPSQDPCVCLSLPP